MNASAYKLVGDIREFTSLFTGIPANFIHLTYYVFEQNVDRDAENAENAARVSNVGGSQCSGEASY